MLSDALTALASTGGTALVSVMVTDGWEGFRARVARLLGRDGTAESRTAAEQLEESRELLAATSGAQLERVAAGQAIAWQARLEDVLERDPDAAAELRALIADLQEHAARSVVQIEQHATAHGHAQQAVQGQGVQNINFGRS